MISIRYPFDWKNPVGYFFAVALQFIALTYCILLFSCTIFVGIGCSLLLVSVTNKDIADDLKFVNKNAKQHRLLALNRLCGFIENYSTLKR